MFPFFSYRFDDNGPVFFNMLLTRFSSTTIDPNDLLAFFDNSNSLHVCELSADDEFSSFYKRLESIFDFATRLVSDSRFFFISEHPDTVWCSYFVVNYFERPCFISLLKSMLLRYSGLACCG
jgi:hypothetical protein